MNVSDIKPNLTDSAQKNIESLFGNFDFEEIVREITEGRFSLKTGGLFQKALSLFLGELKGSFALIGSIAALALISAVIKNLQTSFGERSLKDTSDFAVFVYIAAICAAAFEKAGQFVVNTIGDITLLVHSIIPTMATLCLSGGETVRANLSHPVIFFICSLLAAIIKNVITPLVLLRAAVTLLCAVTSLEGLSEFTELFSKLHKTILTFSMSLFAGVLGITSFAATSFDNLAARGVKFAVSASVPVVGGSISEAMSSIAGSAMLLKNAVGIGGVIILFAMFAIPLLKLAALSLAFRLTAAFTAPVTEKRITAVLRKLAECMDMLFSSVACMGTIMIIAIASIM